MVEQRSQRRIDVGLRIAGSALTVAGFTGSMYFGLENDLLDHKLNVAQTQNVNQEAIQKMQSEKNNDQALFTVSLGAMILGLTLLPLPKKK